MVVYEAVDKEGFDKISKFIRSQSDEYQVATIWRNRWKDVPDFYIFQQEHTDFHFFICEDKTGKVRAVGAINLTECLSVFDGQPFKMWRFGISCMDEADWKKNDGTYFMELLAGIAKIGAETYSVTHAEVCSWGKHTSFFQSLFRNNMKIVEQKDFADLGTLYKVSVDVKKFVGRK